MPTGHAIEGIRVQLFDAAERVLARDGPGGLTSRAVTAEAGVAKGVLHRHFGDVDGFVCELVADRAARLESLGAALDAAVGAGTVAGNLTGALVEVFGPLGMAVVALVVTRDALRVRLRATGLDGIPILTQAAGVLARYLAAEQRIGRLTPQADPAALGPALIGAVHLWLSERPAPEPDAAALGAVVASVTAGALVRDLSGASPVPRRPAG